jgi:hypothetical protein
MPNPEELSDRTVGLERRLDEVRTEAQRDAAQEILDHLAYLDSDDEAWIRQRFGLAPRGWD